MDIERIQIPSTLLSRRVKGPYIKQRIWELLSEEWIDIKVEIALDLFNRKVDSWIQKLFAYISESKSNTFLVADVVKKIWWDRKIYTSAVDNNKFMFERHKSEKSNITKYVLKEKYYTKLQYEKKVIDVLMEVYNEIKKTKSTNKSK